MVYTDPERGSLATNDHTTSDVGKRLLIVDEFCG
jgi:hypothetical protein